MTYIDLINRFWELDKIKKIPMLDINAYLLLLHECNSRRWLNPFKLQTRQLVMRMDVSRNAISEARNRLKLMGLINMKTARGSGATIYLIPDMPVTDRELFERYFDPSDATAAPAKASRRSRNPLSIPNTQPTPSYETYRQDKSFRHRGIDAAAFSPEDYAAAF